MPMPYLVKKQSTAPNNIQLAYIFQGYYEDAAGLKRFKGLATLRQSQLHPQIAN